MQLHYLGPRLRGLCRRSAAVAALALLALDSAQASSLISDLATLTPGRVRAENALWIENPLSARFNTSKQVVVADLQGPAVISMIHFAMPQTLKLNRDVLLRIYWDGEPTPSVDVPLVDFFCDPAGQREEVNTALVNKRRGYNAYFPMPFRQSARLELVYDGPVEPGAKLWEMMPCYSYVLYRTTDRIEPDQGYFHSSWRQETLLLGKTDYLALQTSGRGKFVGWNATVRLPGRDGYPVDMNEKFYVDGETTASVEFQGIEDSFGFSWGFPPSDSMFPLTGYFKFMKGALAYRFFLNDAISFTNSLRVAIGFGVNEDPMFRREFSKPGNALQLSTTAYWYQTEPHAPLPALPNAASRAPAPEQAFWPEKEQLPKLDALRSRGVKLEMLCGRTRGEVFHAENGYGAAVKKGFSFEGWGLPIYHTRADAQEIQIALTVPKNATGRVRLFIIDPDNFEGGRKQEIFVAGKSVGIFEKFTAGRWIEQRIGSESTAEGAVLIQAKNLRPTANAVVSIVEWLDPAL